MGLILQRLWVASCALLAIALVGVMRAEAQAVPGAVFGVSEIKVGALYHDVPGLWSGFSVERPGMDANLEVLFNPWGYAFGGAVRPALGATLNFQHNTSKAYADVRWELGSAAGLFGALGIGAAFHNGQLGDTDPARKALGSPVLFHPSAELGYRFDGTNNVSLFADHMSNGFSRRANAGMDTVGLRLGHRFQALGTDEPGRAQPANFAGFYLGAAGGVRVSETDWDAGTASKSTSRSGFGTGFVGYNWQSGPGVFGFEADAAPGGASSASACGGASIVCQMSVRSIYSIRPRFGWVLDTAMIYGTGGLAIATWDASVVQAGQSLAAHRTTNYGVAVGAGIEYQFGANLLARAEVMHYGLQGNDIATSGGGNVFNQFQSTTGRLGLAWSFH